MSARTGQGKLVMFAAFGAVGCLVAWAAGQGLLSAMQSFEPEGQAGPSLVQKPELPKMPAVVADQPPAPSAPKLPPPPKPKPPSEEMAKRLKDKKAGTGDVQISLIWFNHNDLDLHCIDPRGVEIYFGNKKPVGKSDGWLDVDANVGATTNRPVENIFWGFGKAPLGKYRVFVNHYKNKPGGTNPTRFEVRVLVDGEVREFKGDDYKISNGQPKRLIHEFEIKPQLFLGVPPEVIVNQGGENDLGVEIGRKRLSEKENVQIRFTGLGKGLTIPEISLPRDNKDKAEVKISAAKDAEPGEYMVDVVAQAGATQATARMKVIVRRLPPVLQAALPPVVEISQGAENVLPARIRRDRFQGPVKVAFEGNLEGVEITSDPIAADIDELQIPIKAFRGAAPGERQINVRFTGSEVSTTGTFRLNVKEVSRANLWSWWEILRIAAWTGLLAAGLALALVCGQNYYLNRPLVNLGTLLIVVGSMVAGMTAGGVGQALFAGLAVADLEPMIGFVVGWLLLGGLLGWGVGFFIPNLGGWKAAAAGAIGGVLAAVSFLVVMNIGGVMLGRLLGAVILGAAIGAMVAWVEQVSRRIWLEVRFGARETRSVNLGPEPVKVGGDGSACAVFARGAAPVALRYWLREGKVLCEDVPAKQTFEVPFDQPHNLANLTLTVRSAVIRADQPAAPAAPVAPPKPAAPPAPAPVVAPTRSTSPNACPKCGREINGPLGRRYCVVDDLSF